MILERGKEPYKFTLTFMVTLTLMAVAAWSIMVNCALANNLPAEDTVNQLRPLLVANRQPASGQVSLNPQAGFSCVVAPPPATKTNTMMFHFLLSRRPIPPARPMSGMLPFGMQKIIQESTPVLVETLITLGLLAKLTAFF